MIDNETLKSVTSELTLAETLVKPMADKNLGLQQLYESTIKTSTILHVAPVSREILIKAAQLRSTTNTVNAIRLPDAIHAATALANNCQTLITVVLLSDIKESTLAVES